MKTCNNCMNNPSYCKPKSRANTHSKHIIILLTDTIIKPHTVMVKFFHTPIA